MMCEVREAESTSGGVSRRVDVVGSSGADFDHIGKSIGEVREFEEPKVQECPNEADAFSMELNYKKMWN